MKPCYFTKHTYPYSISNFHAGENPKSIAMNVCAECRGGIENK